MRCVGTGLRIGLVLMVISVFLDSCWLVRSDPSCFCHHDLVLRILSVYFRSFVLQVRDIWLVIASTALFIMER